jgi:hypothetical protein
MDTAWVAAEMSRAQLGDPPGQFKETIASGRVHWCGESQGIFVGAVTDDSLDR